MHNSRKANELRQSCTWQRVAAQGICPGLEYDEHVNTCSICQAAEVIDDMDYEPSVEQKRVSFFNALLILMIFLALTGWTALFIQTGHIQIGTGNLSTRNLQEVKVFRWNQLTQEKGVRAK